MDKIKICYIDDEQDIYLSNYLADLKDFEYEDIIIKPDDTIEDALKKIADKNCNIAILDSKLYKDSNAKQKLTGQEIELLLANRLPYIFSIVISQNDDVNGLNYVGKYKSNQKTLSDAYEESEKCYNDTLLPIIQFASKKINRNKYCFRNELYNKTGIDKMKLQNIESLLDGEERVELTKKDIDEIIKLVGEIQKHES